jgi:dTDP-glucose 4,6-dehydratase
MRKTVQWTLANQDWVRKVQSGDYLKWMDRNYSQREKAAS